MTTHAEFLDRKNRLSHSKRKLLESRLGGRLQNLSSKAIAPRPSGVNPLSFGQERIWFQEQVTRRFDSRSALFNIPLLAFIRGPVDAEALEAAIRCFILRHEVMRSGFVERDGAPRLFFVDEPKFSLVREDLRVLAPEAQEGEARSRASKDALVRFDLDAPPLLRARLLHLHDSHALILTIHHIIWDGWSSAVFIRELTALYESFRSGVEPTLEPLLVQYADFAHWHRRLLASEAGAAQVDYWTAQLRGAPELLDLPLDRPRSAQQAHRGRRHNWRLSLPVSEALVRVAQEKNATLFVLLLSAFFVFLKRSANQEDLSVGTTIAYRARPEFEKLVGFFANALVVRARVSDSMSFDELLNQVKGSSAEAQTNQDVPFEALVERIAASRQLSYNPIFQVAFVHHSVGMGALSFSDLSVEIEELDSSGATFDLVLHVFSEPEGIRLQLEYDTDLFDRLTFSQMSKRLTALISRILEAPEKPVGALSLLDREEEEQVVATGFGPALCRDDDRLLHECVDWSTPAATAVMQGDSAISYSELDERSNYVARSLLDAGIGSEDAVGILVEGGVEFVVCVLGVLKAGGAFLPLDSAYPPSRVAYIASDANIKALMTTKKLKPLYELPGVRVIAVDGAASDEVGDSPMARAAGSQNLAYIIYTSGSTGRSKGVMVSHANAVASLEARLQYYQSSPKRFLILSSLAFDSTLAGLFWTLASGGCVHFSCSDEKRDPTALAALIRTRLVSHLLCLPSLYDALLRVLRPESAKSLDLCIVAGEACKGSLVESHFGVVPHADLFNEYGPTEGSIWSSVQRLAPTGEAAHHVDIGRPIPGGSAFVLLSNSAPAPCGVAGELCIGGPAISRGYVGRADLTAEKFIPDPFRNDGSRLYRTGDRASFTSRGEIVFLGRIDDQIKIRGYRVDPREIEGALSHEGVGEIAVIGEGEDGNVTGLVACVESGGAGFDVESLRRLAVDTLPPFMVPDRIVRFAEWPRLPNGKTDRGELAQRIRKIEQPHVARVVPTNAVEVMLADIWRETLGVAVVGIDDNFFDIGGNSLSAMQVIARIDEIFDAETPIEVVFGEGTIRALSHAILRQIGLDSIEEKLAMLLDELETSGAE